MTVNSEAVYSYASAYWPGLVNINRTRLEVVRKRESWEKPIDPTPIPGTVSKTAEPEQVGPYLMAYDIERDVLYVWEGTEEDWPNPYNDGEHTPPLD